MSTDLADQSAIYMGNIRHRRFVEAENSFNYSLFMLALDLTTLDKPNNALQRSWLFSRRWFSPLRFVEQDYVKGNAASLTQRISDKVKELGADWQGSKIVMVGQCRCLGLYFSPINFYFCYDNDDNCQYMLAEVSNTPWNQRHYYLVNVTAPKATDKSFHVSPFMTLDMQYHWRITPPCKRLLVHIENRNPSKLFDATLALKKKPINTHHLLATLVKIPMMTLKIVIGIYWQALKLFFKKVPFITHPQR